MNEKRTLYFTFFLVFVAGLIHGTSVRGTSTGMTSPRSAFPDAASLERASSAGTTVDHISLPIGHASLVENSPNNSLQSLFLVAPHLMSYLGRPAITWIYKSPLPTAPAQAIGFYKNGALTASAEIQSLGDRGVTFLPQTCGWGDGVTYMMAEMERPQLMENIPCPESDEPLRVAFITDPQLDLKARDGFVREKEMESLVRQAAQFQPNVVLNGGDHVEEAGDTNQWLTYFSILEPLYQHSTVLAAVGNHEYSDHHMPTNFQRYFLYGAGRAYFSQHVGPLQVLILNSNFSEDPSFATTQISWFESALKEPSTWKVVVFHHAPYSSSIMNSALAPDHEWESVQNYLVPLIEKYNVPLVLNGHVHLFERSYNPKTKVTYLSGGPTGGRIDTPTRAWRHNSLSVRMKPQTRTWTQITVNKNELSAVTLDSTGAVVDRFTLSH